MMKLLGAACVMLGAGGFGCSLSLRFHAQRRQLARLRTALALLKCELNYSVAPLEELCRAVSERVGGAVGAFFSAFAARLPGSTEPVRACMDALNDTRELELPKQAKQMLPELAAGLGSYDLEGANRILKLALSRLDALIEQTECERKPLARSYVLLALCAGAAVVILMV